MLAPRPVQTPHPPIRLAANSSQTLEWAGQLGLPVLVAAHVNPLPRLREMLGGYRQAREAAGHPTGPDDITVLAPVFTAPTRGQLKADTAAGFGWLDDTVRANLRRWRAAAPAGPAGDATRRRLDEMATHISAFDFDTMAQTRGILDTPEGLHREVASAPGYRRRRPGDLLVQCRRPATARHGAGSDGTVRRRRDARPRRPRTALTPTTSMS